MGTLPRKHSGRMLITVLNVHSRITSFGCFDTGTFCYITSFYQFYVTNLVCMRLLAYYPAYELSRSHTCLACWCWITWIKSDEHQFFPIMLKLSSGGLPLPVAKLLPQKNCSLFTLVRGLEGHGYNWLMPRWPIWFKLVVNSTSPIVIIYLFWHHANPILLISSFVLVSIPNWLSNSYWIPRALWRNYYQFFYQRGIEEE